MAPKNLQDHIKRVHEMELKIQCEHPGCDKKFFNNFEMRAHVANSHSKERNFVCEVCAASYGTMTKLKTHLKNHGELKHACTQCDKTFPTSAKLDEHVKRVHENVRNFSCEHCGKAYFKKKELDIHKMAKHTSIKIRCGVEGCSSEFTRRDTYREHLNYAHKLTKDEIEDLKKKLNEFLAENNLK